MLSELDRERLQLSETLQPADSVYHQPLVLSMWHNELRADSLARRARRKLAKSGGAANGVHWSASAAPPGSVPWR